MQIYFHSRLCSYLPRVPILVEGTVANENTCPPHASHVMSHDPSQSNTACGVTAICQTTFNTRTRRETRLLFTSYTLRVCYYCSCFIEATFQIGCGCACGHPLADLKSKQRQLWIIVLKHVIHSQQTVQMLQVQTVMQNDNIQRKFTSGYLWFMQSACIIIVVFRISEGIAINGI